MRVEIEIHCFNECDNTGIYSCFAEYSKDGNTITQSEVDDRTKKIASDALLMTSKILEVQTNQEGSLKKEQTNQEDVLKKEVKYINSSNGFNPNANCCGTVNYPDGFNPMTNWDGTNYDFRFSYDKCYKSSN